jgi:hypothetical protein
MQEVERPAKVMSRRNLDKERDLKRETLEKR